MNALSTLLGARGAGRGAGRGARRGARRGDPAPPVRRPRVSQRRAWVGEGLIGGHGRGLEDPTQDDHEENPGA